MILIRGIRVNILVVLILGSVASCVTELRLLLSVFRHGDRYPIGYDFTKVFYPLNPYANVSWFPDAYEGLTDEGKRRSFELGNVLRKRYGEWLGQIYSKKICEFWSSTSDRTVVTALLVAAGLFPPSDSQKWNPRLNWQPIPIHRVPREESVLYFGIFCTQYIAMLEDIKKKNPTIAKYEKDMQQFYDYVSSNTGATVTNRIAYYLYLEFLAAKSGGLEAPEWTEGIYPDGKLREAAINEYYFSSWTDELKLYTGGLWIRKWLEYVKTYLMPNGVKTKAYFYGGHDVNIAGIMTTLGIFYRHIPNYASTINFELHEDDDRHFYVKVVYRDSDEFVEQLIPGCDRILCPLETFKVMLAKIIPTNRTLECGTRIY